MQDLLNKLRKKKGGDGLNNMEMHAKSSVLHDMKRHAEEAMGSKLDGLKTGSPHTEPGMDDNHQHSGVPEQKSDSPTSDHALAHKATEVDTEGPTVDMHEGMADEDTEAHEDPSMHTGTLAHENLHQSGKGAHGENMSPDELDSEIHRLTKLKHHKLMNG
jgi:hypothetical protein